MLIVTWKEDAEDRWIKYDSTYGTAKLLARYAAVLWESEEEARALVVRFTAGVVVEFSRRVDGAFLHCKPAMRQPESAAPMVASTEFSLAIPPLRNYRERARGALVRLLPQRARQSPLRARAGHRRGHCKTAMAVFPRILLLGAPATAQLPCPLRHPYLASAWTAARRSQRTNMGPSATARTRCVSAKTRTPRPEPFGIRLECKLRSPSCRRTISRSSRIRNHEHWHES